MADKAKTQKAAVPVVKKRKVITAPAIVKETWRDVEIHGWKWLVETESRYVKIFLMIILLGCFGICTWYLIRIFQNYYDRPLDTSYSIVYNGSNGMRFPDITICPSNTINWSLVNDQSELLEYAVYIKELTKKTMSKKGNTNSFNYTILDLNEKIMKIGYDAEKFLLGCGFQENFAVYINCSEIMEEKTLPNYGKCFVIKLGNRNQTIAKTGLTVTLLLHKELYPTNNTLSPDLDGAIVQIDEESTFLRPGSHYNIDIRAMHLVLINFDSGKIVRRCVGNEENEFEYKILNRISDNYTQPSCIQDCHLQYILTHCGCLPLIDPQDVKPQIVNESTLACDPVRTENCVGNSEINESQTCMQTCHSPCDQILYKVRPTDAPLHEEGYRKLLHQANTTIDNLIELYIAYPTLDYIELSQNESKSFEELVSDFGNQIGLWIGVSMATMIQIPFLLTTFCGHASFRKGRKAMKTASMVFTKNKAGSA